MKKFMMFLKSASIVLNALCLVFLFLVPKTQVLAPGLIMNFVITILILDTVVEFIRLFSSFGQDRVRAYWSGALRMLSLTMNLVAVSLMFLPLSWEKSTTIIVVGLIIAVDLVVDVVEAIKFDFAG